jgi:two-component system LytT family response regulator
MIKVLIIEDETAIQQELTYLIKKEVDLQLCGICDTVGTALDLIKREQPDVILMDIQLRDGNAFDVLVQLPSIPEHIVFISAYNQYAIKAIKFGALDYLLKPIVEEELKEAIERFRKKKEKNPIWQQQIALVQNNMRHKPELPETIALHTLNKVSIIPVVDIVYCKGDGPYTSFFLKDNSKELVSKPLKFYEELLPPPFFLRTHQSYLVNRSYIKGISNSEVLQLSNNIEIPVSTRRKAFILNHILS